MTTTLATPADPVAGDPDRPWARRLLVGMIFLGVTLVMLRPTVYDLNHTLTNLGDPALVGWIVSWSSHVLLTDPTSVFQANIFWPHPDSLAYTDSLLLLAPPFALVRALGGSWALGVNLVTIALLLVSLAATYALARRLTGRTDAALLAAIAFTYSSYTFAHIGHTHLLLIGQFSLGFLATFTLLERPRWQAGVLLGLLNVSFCLGSLYYALTWAICLVTILAIHVIRQRMKLGRTFWAVLALTGAVSMLAAPIFVPYMRLSEDRPLVAEWGFKLGDAVTVAPGSYLYEGLDDWASMRNTRWEHSFFPGFSTGALAIVGTGAVIMGGIRRRRRPVAVDDLQDADADRRRRELWILIAAAVPTTIIALGSETRGYAMPFAWLHDHVPGFGGIRITARFAIPALLAGCVLAAVGYAALTTRLRKRASVMVATALLAVLVFELAGPLTHLRVPEDRATLAVYRELNRRPDGAVAELPMMSPVEGGGRAWSYVEALRMLYSTLDFHPRVNGQSGGWPEEYPADIAELNQFPGLVARRAAQRLRVRYFVLHTGPAAGFPQYSVPQVQRMLRGLPAGVSARRYGDSWLVDLGPPS